MKKIVLAAAIILISVSCATVKVSSDFDKTAQFADYKTYKITQESMNLQLDDINTGRIIKAVENELALKGFTKSESPDVLIDLKLTAQAKQTAKTNTTPYYGSRYRYRWGGGFSTTTIDYEQYVEGTLFVDIIDAAKSQLVWQGRGVGTISPDIKPEKREQNINAAVKKVFEEYPPKM